MARHVLSEVMLSVRRTLLAATPLLLLLACSVTESASDDSSAAISGAAGDAVSFSVVPSREWVRCWTQPGRSEQSDLLCQSMDIAGYPFALDSINVSIAHHSDADIVSGGRAERRAVTVDTLAAEDFPITVNVTVTVGLDDSNEGTGLAGKKLTTSFVVASAADGATPKVFRQPFDIWPVAVHDVFDRSRPDDFSMIRFSDYAVPLGEFVLVGADGIHAKEPTDEGNDPTTMYLLAPTTGAIPAVDQRFFQPTAPPTSQQAITIPQPGIYVTGSAGFRAATGADNVRLPRGFPFVSPTDVGDGGSPSPAPTPSDAGAP